MKPRLIRMVAIDMLSGLASRGYLREDLPSENELCEIMAEFFAVHLERQADDLRAINDLS